VIGLLITVAAEAVGVGVRVKGWDQIQMSAIVISVLARHEQSTRRLIKSTAVKSRRRIINCLTLMVARWPSG